MSEKNTNFVYDEEDSVEFIRESLSQELQTQLDDDDIHYIVDLMYEFYDEKGFLSEDNEDDDIEYDEEELISYIIKNAKNDDVKTFTEQQVTAVIDGELAYCDSLEDEEE